jgi:leucyl aminopeptidase
MSKLTVELIAEKVPGHDDEVGLNERKPNSIQYFLDPKTLKFYLGPKKELTPQNIREKISEADWKNYSETEVELVNSSSLSADLIEAAYEVIHLKSFIFDKYKTSNDDRHVLVKKFSFKNKKPEGLKLDTRDEIITAVKFCRDIVSSNADTITPGQMEKFAQEIANHNSKIKLKVIDADQAKKLGMGCLLAVGAESLKNNKKDHHPRLVILEYTGPGYVPFSSKARKSKQQEHVCLVGKGITFDTGGLCLKPTKYMLDMKSDMAGSATVLSVFKALSNLDKDLRPDIKITGILALAENGFGASSYKPGDVLKAMNGKTVQVVDTDAEGRLVLADALSYASSLKEKPTKIIDLATLTGSIVSTLGEVAAGAMTNNEEFFKKVFRSFQDEGEKLWMMPLFEQYKKLLDSDIADIKHCNTRPDALCAGIFLREFINPDSAWLHLDIAGVGFIENDGLWAYKGATGFGVKGLTRYLLDL